MAMHPLHSAPLLILGGLAIASKIPTLAIPAYWDEAGWFHQAVWLSNENLIRVIPGFREPSTFWGHPPGLHFIVASVAKISGGVSLTLAHLVVALFAAIGVCATYLLARRSFQPAVAWTAAILLLLSPVYFAQSGMFLADVPVTALGALVTFLAMSGRYRAYAVCASCMVLLKETAAAIVLAIAIYKFLEAPHAGRTGVRELLRYCAPLAALGIFVLVQKIATGHFFWIYDFPVETPQLTAEAVSRQFGRVNGWIFLRQNRFVFTALILLSLIFSRTARRRSELGLFLLILIFSAWPFAFIYYLPRYLTPVLPLFCILTAAALFDLATSRAMRRAGIAVLLVFAGATLATQPLTENGETSLRYLDVVAINKQAIAWISKEHPQATVVTTFPNEAALRDTLLGYVSRPLSMKRFSDVDVSDLGGAELILVSQPSARDGNALRRLALRQSWRRVARFERSGAWAELYAKSPAPAGVIPRSR